MSAEAALLRRLAAYHSAACGGTSLDDLQAADLSNVVQKCAAVCTAFLENSEWKEVSESGEKFKQRDVQVPWWKTAATKAWKNVQWAKVVRVVSEVVRLRRELRKEEEEEEERKKKREREEEEERRRKGWGGRRRRREAQREEEEEEEREERERKKSGVAEKVRNVGAVLAGGAAVYGAVQCYQEARKLEELEGQATEVTEGNEEGMGRNGDLTLVSVNSTSRLVASDALAIVRSFEMDGIVLPPTLRETPNDILKLASDLEMTLIGIQKAYQVQQERTRAKFLFYVLLFLTSGTFLGRKRLLRARYRTPILAALSLAGSVSFFWQLVLGTECKTTVAKAQSAAVEQLKQIKMLQVSLPERKRGVAQAARSVRLSRQAEAKFPEPPTHAVRKKAKQSNSTESLLSS